MAASVDGVTWGGFPPLRRAEELPPCRKKELLPEVLGYLQTLTDRLEDLLAHYADTLAAVTGEQAWDPNADDGSHTEEEN